jgi:hypothetical protein
VAGGQCDVLGAVQVRRDESPMPLFFDPQKCMIHTHMS